MFIIREITDSGGLMKRDKVAVTCTDDYIYVLICKTADIYSIYAFLIYVAQKWLSHFHLLAVWFIKMNLTLEEKGSCSSFTVKLWGLFENVKLFS